jgi:AGZA family xanthine/uracil permease-like MFS transporter
LYNEHAADNMRLCLFAAAAAAGIREGGRTGITALTVAFGFLVSLFFTPLIASIPPFATGPALVLVRLLLLLLWVDIIRANLSRV